MDISPTKLRIARAQLGTALALFVRDRDPFSVHSLACGGSEVIDGLACQAGIQTISTHILQTFEDIDLRKIRSIRNQYWNAIKHVSTQNDRAVRNDEVLLQSFDDKANDPVLFSGWLDYLLLVKRLPVEVQVFQVWWYATNEERMNPDSDRTVFRSLFPGIADLDRPEQKRQLRRAIEKYRCNAKIFQDPRTEPGPLILASW